MSKPMYFTADMSKYASYKTEPLDIIMPDYCVAAIYRIFEVADVNTKMMAERMIKFLNSNADTHGYRNFDAKNLDKLPEIAQKDINNIHVSYTRDLFKGAPCHFKERDLKLSDVKKVTFKSVDSLTDSTTQILYAPINNTVKFEKVQKYIAAIIEYASNHDITFTKKPLTIHNYRASRETLSALEGYKGFVSQELLLKGFKKFEKQLSSIVAEFKKTDVDFKSLVQKEWTGSLDDEEVFNYGKAFYIIAVDGKNAEGFVGMKSVYNRGNSNSYTYTLVKDIKNASLFTEGAKYNLYYGLTEKDRLYVDIEFKPLVSPKSELGNKLSTFIEKNKIAPMVSEAAPVVKRTNKL